MAEGPVLSEPGPGQGQVVDSAPSVQYPILPWVRRGARQDQIERVMRKQANPTVGNVGEIGSGLGRSQNGGGPGSSALRCRQVYLCVLTIHRVCGIYKSDR